MIKIIAVLSMFILCFQPQEAVSTRVIYQDMAVTLDKIINDTDNVVVVKPSDRGEVFLEKTIPQKAGLPPPDEGHKKYVHLHEVVSVLKSKTIKPGQIIKVWDQPFFSYEGLKIEYEKNKRRSPIIFIYKPQHEPAEGQNFILMLADKETEKSIFRRVGEEGLATQGEIEKILKAPQ